MKIEFFNPMILTFWSHLPYWSCAQEVGVGDLFADAKLAKNLAQKIVWKQLSGDLPKVILG